MLQRVRAKGFPWPAPSFFASRPLFCLSVCFIIGIAAAKAVPYAQWIWLVVIGLAVLAVLLRRVKKAAFALALLCMLSLGYGRGGMELKPPALPIVGKWTVEGTITDAVTHNDRAVMFWLRDVRLLQDDGYVMPIDGTMYVYYPTEYATRLAHGQRVSVSGSSYLPTAARNPGGFDQRMWMAQKGAHVRLYATSAPKILTPAPFSVKGLALSLNASLGAYMDSLYGEASPVIRAMLLGDQRGMPDEWSEWMRGSGLAHLLAVSGLHVALWFVLLERLVRFVPLSPKARWWVLAALLAAYALLTGLKPSVLRAVIMLLAVQGARVGFRRADMPTSLSLAAFVILLFRPLDLFGASFQMSFTSVVGISLLRGPIRRALPIRQELIADGLSTTLSAQLGILPVLTRWFGTVPLLGSLANLVCVPLVGILIPMAAAGAALHAVWAPLGWLFIQSARGMVAVMMLLARVAASVPLAHARLGAFAWWTAAAYYCGLVLLSGVVVWRWPARLISIATVCVLAVVIGFFSGSFYVRYVQLDVGQALSGVLHVGRATYVYDTGDEGSDLTEYLMYTGSDVDALFLSHPHKDHTGGLSELLDAGIRIGTLFVPVRADAFGAEPDYAARLAQAEAQGAAIVEVAAGDVFNLNGVMATVVAPDADSLRGSDPNDRSIVLLLAIGEHLLLLMGDADGAAEPLGVDTDVLQVAHHGSRNAARDAFLQDATPDIALISTGRNSYGHPNPETIARLDEAGADIYITQDSGALTLYFLPGSIRVEAYIP